MTEKLVTSACCQLPFDSFDNEVSLEVTFPRGRQNCEKEFKIKSPWYCLIISSFQGFPVFAYSVMKFQVLRTARARMKVDISSYDT